MVQRLEGIGTMRIQCSRPAETVGIPVSASIGTAILGIAVSARISSFSSPDFDVFRIPRTLSGTEKVQRIKKPKSKMAENCTSKCVSTCIRGGAGSPGEGPLNIRRPLVVFKEGFRSRHYCLIECADICNLIKDGEDGP